RGDLVALVLTPQGAYPEMWWKDPRDGKVLHHVGRVSNIRRIVFNSDGQRFAMLDGGQDVVFVWDVPSKSKILTLSLKSLFPVEQRGPSSHVAISANGDRVAVGYNVGDAGELIRGCVKIYDAVTGAEVNGFEAHLERINDLAFCPSGQRLATV